MKQTILLQHRSQTAEIFRHFWRNRSEGEAVSKRDNTIPIGKCLQRLVREGGAKHVREGIALHRVELGRGVFGHGSQSVPNPVANLVVAVFQNGFSSRQGTRNPSLDERARAVERMSCQMRGAKSRAGATGHELAVHPKKLEVGEQRSRAVAAHRGPRGNDNRLGAEHIEGFETDRQERLLGRVTVFREEKRKQGLHRGVHKDRMDHMGGEALLDGVGRGKRGGDCLTGPTGGIQRAEGRAVVQPQFGGGLVNGLRGISCGRWTFHRTGREFGGACGDAAHRVRLPGVLRHSVAALDCEAPALLLELEANRFRALLRQHQRGADFEALHARRLLAVDQRSRGESGFQKRRCGIDHRATDLVVREPRERFDIKMVFPGPCRLAQPVAEQWMFLESHQHSAALGAHGQKILFALPRIMRQLDEA